MSRSMSCSEAFELASARLDSELAPGEESALDDHLRECSGCRAILLRAQALHREYRVGAAPSVPDHTAEILAAHGDRPTRTRRRLVATGLAAASVLLAFTLGLVALTDRADEPPLLSADPAVATPASQGGRSAVYVTIVNHGGADSIVAASSSVATRVTLHRTEQRDGLLVMTSQPTHRIDRLSTTYLSPGGAHVMLEDLTSDLEIGDRIELDIRFERSEPVTVPVEVVSFAELEDRVPVRGSLDAAGDPTPFAAAP